MHRLTPVALLVAGLAIAGCESGPRDLSAYGLPITIQAPERAKVQAGSAGAQIIAPGQALSVMPSGGDNEMRKWIETGVDEDDVLMKEERRPDGWLAVWREQRGTTQAFDFVRYRADLDLICAPLSAPATQVDLEAMLATCETIRPLAGAAK